MKDGGSRLHRAGLAILEALEELPVPANEEGDPPMAQPNMGAVCGSQVEQVLDGSVFHASTKTVKSWTVKTYQS